MSASAPGRSHVGVYRVAQMMDNHLEKKMEHDMEGSAHSGKAQARAS